MQNRWDDGGSRVQEAAVSARSKTGRERHIGGRMQIKGRYDEGSRLWKIEKQRLKKKMTGGSMKRWKCNSRK